MPKLKLLQCMIIFQTFQNYVYAYSVFISNFWPIIPFPELTGRIILHSFQHYSSVILNWAAQQGAVPLIIHSSDNIVGWENSFGEMPLFLRLNHLLVSAAFSSEIAPTARSHSDVRALLMIGWGNIAAINKIISSRWQCFLHWGWLVLSFDGSGAVMAKTVLSCI